MIPLSVFLIAWFVLLGIYGILSLISIMQMIRFGVAGTMTYISTFLFVAVAAFVIVGVGLYLLTVDWGLSLDFSKMLQPPSYINL